ncbi:MAG: hypothetical protein AAF975_05240, partial [Spirochaetota bacterium]
FGPAVTAGSLERRRLFDAHETFARSANGLTYHRCPCETIGAGGHTLDGALRRAVIPGDVIPGRGWRGRRVARQSSFFVNTPPQNLLDNFLPIHQWIISHLSSIKELLNNADPYQ